MILLLVIAMLVLLALMGTIFILMASTDRKSAYASNSSVSLNLAQQGVLNTVRGLMLNQTLDATAPAAPLTLAIGTDTAGVFTPAPQIARFWDYPEVGAMASSGDTSGFYQSATVGVPPTPTQYAPSEPWLVSNQPYEPNDIPGTATPQTLYVPGEEVYYATENTASPFNVTYVGRQVYTGTANIAPPTGWTAASTSTVAYAAVSAQTTTGVPLISTLSPYLYDPSTGTYIIPWQVAGTVKPGGPISVPNAAVVAPRWAYNNSASYAISNQLQPTGTLDAMWNLLPYSSPNGTRYRFATRIMDMSSMLNLNTGWIPSADPNQATNTPYAEYGAYTSYCPILNNLVNAASLDIPPSEGGTGSSTALQDNTFDLQAGNTTTTPAVAGRIGSYPSTTAFYSLPTWQNALNEYEIQYPNSASPPTEYSAFFGANSEMDLLTAAGAGGAPFGSPYYSRVATLLPNTLGLYPTDNYYGSGYRGLYTTDSWTRDVAAVNLNLNIVPGATAQPKVNLNTPVTSTATAATLAGYLYSTMLACGYNQAHAGSFVADYLAYRFGNTGVKAGSETFYEPPYIASGGTLYMPQFSATTSAPITAMKADTNSYVGTTAQPFINEFEAQITTNGTPGDAVKAAATISHWSLELMNPFPTQSWLDLHGWEVAINGTVVVGDLGGLASGATGYPAIGGAIGSYTNAVNNGGPLAVVLSDANDPMTSQSPTPANTPVITATTPGAVSASAANTITLLRPEAGAPAQGGVPAGYVVVDSMTFDVSAFTYPATPTTFYADSQRDNVRQQEWGCDSFAASVPTPMSAPVATGGIGVLNTAPVGGTSVGMPLYDRIDDAYTTPYTPFLANGPTPAEIASSGYALINIDDFNCISREGNYSTATGTEPLSAQIFANTPAASGAAVATAPSNLGMFYVSTAQTAKDPVLSTEEAESALYFDFAYDPRAAYTAADAGDADPVVTAKGTAGEVPPTILSMTTLTDRSQSNTAAASALPGSNADLVRQAGKININTAGPDVLYSIFSEDGAMSGDTTPVQQSLDISALVDDAIAFRQRLAAGTAGLPLFAVTTGPVVVTPVANANNYSIYAGTAGFRSNADLLVALLPTIESGKFPTGQVATPTTLQQRDAAWADVENFITVRSDTFAVYGLVQALRLNPAYVAGGGTVADLATDWYNANQGVAPGTVGPGAQEYEDTISTDPTNQNAEFILRGSRRFIAIVDRSYCNNGTAVQPHIVALKILPQ